MRVGVYLVCEVVMMNCGERRKERSDGGGLVIRSLLSLPTIMYDHADHHPASQASTPTTTMLSNLLLLLVPRIQPWVSSDSPLIEMWSLLSLPSPPRALPPRAPELAGPSTGLRERTPPHFLVLALPKRSCWDALRLLDTFGIVTPPKSRNCITDCPAAQLGGAPPPRR